MVMEASLSIEKPPLSSKCFTLSASFSIDRLSQGLIRMTSSDWAMAGAAITESIMIREKQNFFMHCVLQGLAVTGYRQQIFTVYQRKFAA
jgi:hypothetical protein